MKIDKICNAKINLGLFIKGKRMDGYHEIETVMIPVPEIFDEISVKKVPIGYWEFQQSGLTIDVPIQENIIYKAWKKIKEEFGIKDGLSVSLNKRIPMGAGLGGGSSNAANILLIINELFQLGITSDVLHKFARSLGADAPFFLYNKPLYAGGIGDEFQEIDMHFPFKIQVVTPSYHSSTAEAYNSLILNECSTHKDLKSIILGDFSAWKTHLTNDFEKPIFQKFPELRDIKQAFYDNGAVYASMTGSGSAIYGLF